MQSGIETLLNLTGIELFFTILIFCCGMFYLHFFLNYSWNQKQLSLLDKREDYNLIGFGFWGMLVCVFTLGPIFIESNSDAFVINIILLLFCIVTSRYYYFLSLRKLLNLPAFDKYYLKLVYLYLGISIVLLLKTSDLGSSLLFDVNTATNSPSSLRNIMLPYELKRFVKLLFIPNFLFCFIAYVYLIYKSYKREEYLITFGVSFTLLAIFYSNSYHLFQFKYWIPINALADVFELFRLNIAQKKKINNKIIEIQKGYEDLDTSHKVFKHDLINKFSTSLMSLERVNKLIKKNEEITPEVLKNVDRALKAQVIAKDYVSNYRNKVEINLRELIEELESVYGIEIELSLEDNDKYVFNSIKVDINNILVNLIKNSIEANSGERIWIRLNFFEDNDSYHFKFTDSGDFDKVTNKDQIFEQGYSSKGSDDRGLGLFSIKSILTELGGNIKLINNNGNTCFQFSLKK